jgi:hypothetical protein
MIFLDPFLGEESAGEWLGQVGWSVIAGEIKKPAYRISGRWLFKKSIKPPRRMAVYEDERLRHGFTMAKKPGFVKDLCIETINF